MRAFWCPCSSLIEGIHHEMTTRRKYFIWIAQTLCVLVDCYVIWLLLSTVSSGELVKMSVLDMAMPVVLINAGLCVFFCGWIWGGFYCTRNLLGNGPLISLQLLWVILAISSYIVLFRIY